MIPIAPNLHRIQIGLLGVVLLLGLPGMAHSQGSRVPDSLTQELNNAASQEDKIEAYGQIIHFFLRRNPAKAFEYAQKADSIARVHELVDKRPTVIRLKGNSFYYRRKYAEAQRFYRQAMRLADSLGNEEEVNSVREDLALVAMDQGDFEKAHRLWETVIKSYRSKGDSLGVANVRINRGMTYYNEQNFPRALANFQKALQYFQNRGAKEEVAGLYNNIGMVHKSNKDNSKAAEYYNKALTLWEEMDDWRGIAMTSNNLGIVYSELGNNEKALHHLRKSLKIAQKMGNTRGISNNERNMGIIYSEMDQPDSALVHLKKALDLARQGGQKQNIIPIYNEMASVYHSKGLTSKAVNAASRALELNRQLKLPRARMNGNEVLYKIYDERGNAPKALKHYKAFVSARDSVRSRENYREIVQMEYQYNLEQERQKHRLEQEKQQAELEKQKLFRNASIGGVLLLLIAGLFGFRSYRIKQRANQALEAKNKEIEAQRGKLAEQAKNLRANNEKLKELDRFKEGMTSMLVHDLKNPLNKVLLASQRGISEEHGDPEDLKKIQRSGKHMLTMVENILDVYRYEDSNMDLDLQKIELSDFVAEALDRNVQLTEPKNIGLINRTARGSYVWADRQILSRIFDNLLSNAIKHTPNNGKISVAASMDSAENLLEISVSDNGEGIPGDQQDKIFERFEQVQTRTPANSGATGLGLTFCKLAVEAHGGEIGVDSTPGVGTTMKFSLPAAGKVAASPYERVTPDKGTSQKSGDVELDEEELSAIEDKLESLRTLEIYEVSAIRDLLSDIDSGYSDNIKQWKRHVLNAVMVGNEARYDTLVNLNKESMSYG